MPKSAYIHIPFCKSKCNYCSFISYKKLDLIFDYIEKLEQEILYYYKKEPLTTLYFGGGTPSLLSVELVQRVKDLFLFEGNSEITIEVNPDDCSIEYFQGLKNIGVNRISIGSQTFDDEILKIIGRRHNSISIEAAVNNAKEAGFNNVSVDLIYGLPEQNLDKLKKDIERFLELDIQHISTYGLKIEEGTFFAKNNPPNLPNDEMQADMYIFINDILKKCGFNRYEVSNFAKPGFESRHNMNYWDNAEYYGFGVAAHGYINGIRHSNKVEIEKYILNPTEHLEEKVLTNQEKLEEAIFLGLRKVEGININDINKLYNIDFVKKYFNILKKYKDYFEITEDVCKLNIDGVLVSNCILSDFLEV